MKKTKSVVTKVSNSKTNVESTNTKKDPDPLLEVDELTKSSDELDTYITDIAETVRLSLDESISKLTPWFFKNMPQIYYQTIPKPDKVRHLSSIITGHVFENKQTVELWNRDRSEVTFIGPGNDPTALTDLAKRLEPLKAKTGALYYSHDRLLFIANFYTASFQNADLSNPHLKSKVNRAKKILQQKYPESTTSIDKYITNLDHHFVMYGTARRICNTFRMYQKMLFKEGVHTFFEAWEDDPGMGRLTIGMKEVKASEVLEDILHLINRYGFDVNRYFVVHFEEKMNEAITVININVVSQDRKKIDFQSVPVRKLIKALRTLAWVDSDEYSLLVREPYFFSVNAANFVRSVAAWVHILLGKQNAYYFSEHRILTTFWQSQEAVAALAELFRVRFSPLLAEERKKGAYAERRAAMVALIEKVVDPIEKQIFQEGLKFVDHILLTNYYFHTKTGLAFRVSSDVLDERYYPQKPFAIYFIIGRDYRFFHVRWKDIARGGLRIVMPRNAPEYAYALSGLFDEVYGLSYAQQLKNKDIPEGGSKAVMLLKLNANRNRAAKGAVNSLLDLLVREEETQEDKGSFKMVSYYDQDEIIYLGPDENVTNDLIVWITDQAERRNYKYSKAFMSSKPGAGINHKEYGVTSEGLNVYVDHVLKFLQIDPKQKAFTVKMTGGPDGDVAGNELKILHREYGENARVVAIADGLGAAYDPKGLNWQELLRLVRMEKSIAEFDRSKLSKGSTAFVVRADTSENILRRNELHFVTSADIFIPAGGRPYTVNAQNWPKFLDANKKPSCRAIVEGANIFFTAEARDKLQEAGVVIVKDSSANKCGVVCSSYEVIESMILDVSEFMSIKATYVEHVIQILRDIAGKEARLLFREYAQRAGKKNLVELSKEISQEINDLTDILLKEFTSKGSQLIKDPMYLKLIYKHCPPILVEKYRERIVERLPLTYIVAILAAQIASSIVYNEGLDWMDSIADRNVIRAACNYMQNLENTEKLIASIQSSKLANKDEITTILQHSAARVLTMLSLEK